ncbi:MAG: YceI family protein [Bdellovibrionales bacterium]
MRVCAVAMALMLASAFGPRMALGAPTQKFIIDDTHTSALFKVSHLGFSNVYGLMGGAEGFIQFNEAQPEKSTFEISFKPETTHSLAAKRDDHLKKQDFFNAKQFPKITLKSKSIKKLDGNKYEVNGELTLHGVPKPLKVIFTHFKTAKDPWGKTRFGGEAQFQITRTEFNMTYMSKAEELGDTVDLIVNVEAVR